MNTRKNSKNGDELSILGFGCMRLPMKRGNVDEGRAIDLIRKAVDGGINYFDTAYIYHRGRSEGILGRALEGGLRERVKVATKLPPYLVRSLDGAKRIFDTQLERLRTGSIDYYLLHAIADCGGVERLAHMGVMDWLERLKAEGRIRNLGFSFHGTKAAFEELVMSRPWDFCQIQYNYLDENAQATRDGLMLAAGMGLPVIAMEPLRGGALAGRLPPEAQAAFTAINRERSPAEWALRWVWNHPEITVALSGMSDDAQLEENLRVAEKVEANTLSHTEREAFSRAKGAWQKKMKIPCTACGYCLPCPYGVDIPGCFSHYNDKYLHNKKRARWSYLRDLGALAKQPAIASKCVACGRCEALCPQGINIIGELKTVSREMEGMLLRPALSVVRRFLRIGHREEESD